MAVTPLIKSLLRAAQTPLVTSHVPGAVSGGSSFHREPAALQTRVTLHDSWLKAEVGRAATTSPLLLRWQRCPLHSPQKGHTHVGLSVF